MRTPSWRQGYPGRVMLAVTVAGALVLSVWSMNGLVDLSGNTDGVRSESASPAPRPPANSARPDDAPAPGSGGRTPEPATGSTTRDTAQGGTTQSSPLAWPGPRSVIDATLAQVPLGVQSANGSGSSGTSDSGDQTDSPGPGGQPGPGVPGPPGMAPPPLPGAPSTPGPPDAPEADTDKARKTLASATSAVTAVPRTVDGMDVDAYVRKYSTQLGSQIRKVERGITGAVPDTRPPDTRPPDTSPPTTPPKDSGTQPRRDNKKQTQRQRGDVRGIDVSGWQKNVNWKYWWKKGKRFAYVKATEGTGYTNPYYAQQYNGSRKVGMIRGAYHFALPDRSSGAAQAVYFATNGGGWTRDGKTLPGALDLEWNPYGPACYGKSKAGMRAWVKSFHDTYKARTGRWPVIYTSTSWWSHCVGGGHGFAKTVPLWVARYSNNVGALPPGWNRYTFWQYSSDPIDQNTFNGSHARLRALANGR